MAAAEVEKTEKASPSSTRGRARKLHDQGKSKSARKREKIDSKSFEQAKMSRRQRKNGNAPFFHLFNDLSN
ncbi:hypothetical protein HPP92_027731 [Vanilla planifolia]|uniref:Uncharacterized protein n=1 Tax=Vanilla planifolia TaxID=51239 RepID=A0A835U3X4_VANPL|nr:hypothetical protein HPP92_027731 [Vanilla planifolia]KAG0480373.1 hypothetical protein HPP92_011231 [Vanilla planifolia]